MPAKLDTSKPLRLIGIQIYEGTHENVRKDTWMVSIHQV